MRTPILVRPLTDAERGAMEAGLRSSDAFTLRRCRIVRASADGVPIPRIARNLGCDERTVRTAVHAFNACGTSALATGSSCAHTVHRALDAAAAEKLREVLHRSPRDFGSKTGLWTPELAATEAVRQGVTATEVAGATIRATLVRLGVRWRRAEEWITGPDPEYARQKGGATA